MRRCSRSSSELSMSLSAGNSSSRHKALQPREGRERRESAAPCAWQIAAPCDDLDGRVLRSTRGPRRPRGSSESSAAGTPTTAPTAGDGSSSSSFGWAAVAESALEEDSADPGPGPGPAGPCGREGQLGTARMAWPPDVRPWSSATALSCPHAPAATPVRARPHSSALHRGPRGASIERHPAAARAPLGPRSASFSSTAPAHSHAHAPAWGAPQAPHRRAATPPPREARAPREPRELREPFRAPREAHEAHEVLAPRPQARSASPSRPTGLRHPRRGGGRAAPLRGYAAATALPGPREWAAAEGVSWGSTISADTTSSTCLGDRPSKTASRDSRPQALASTWRGDATHAPPARSFPRATGAVRAMRGHHSAICLNSQLRAARSSSASFSTTEALPQRRGPQEDYVVGLEMELARLRSENEELRRHL